MTGFRTEATAQMITGKKLTDLSEGHAAFWRYVTVCKWDKPRLKNKKT